MLLSSLLLLLMLLSLLLLVVDIVAVGDVVVGVAIAYATTILRYIGALTGDLMKYVTVFIGG